MELRPRDQKVAYASIYGNRCDQDANGGVELESAYRSARRVSVTLGGLLEWIS